MLHVQSLSYEIKGRPILRDIDISIQKGEFYAIVGANGAGKTSLLRMLASDLKPNKGEILFKGKPLRSYSLKELAYARAFLHQSNSMAMAFTVEEVVRMGRYHLKASQEQHDLAITECMRICEVADLAERKIQQLSGGEQQRVHFARVLAQVWDQKDVLLLLDEPVASMDIQFQHQTLAIAKALTAVGFSVVAILHELNLVAQYADRVLMLKSGRKWWEGAPIEVLKPENIYAVFGVQTKVITDIATLTPSVQACTVHYSAARFNSNYKHELAMELKEKYESYKKDNPKARIYDCAKALAVSEAQLLLTQLSDDVVLLKNDIWAILQELPRLGHVMALTRNDACVHERKGIYPTPSNEGHVVLFHNDDIDLRIFIQSWAYSFAVKVKDLWSVQFFDTAGLAVHKVYLTKESDSIHVYEELVHAYRAEDQSYFTIQAPTALSDISVPDTEIHINQFQEDWLKMKDSHEFFGLLRKHNLQRTQALRLAPDGFAEQLAADRFFEILNQASVQEVPVMVFVSNKGCIQIHSGLITKLVTMDNWFNVLDTNFNLHLNTDAIDQIWLVRKPSTDGDVHALEVYDKKGNLIVQLFGKRKPGIPELESWRSLLQVQKIEN
ncbi:heme ABC transporter ATP-binding protein [Sphingobacterium faecium]|uniref:heme ABC transporter ATP-binding protein n=1 Tax=Sphingobacterium faecium TaxID=34087 RepID=UPI00246994D3|nr:heme ABC transporter ATP-binding protein [Sphingobacterium faecium]MDH5826185.1 heme ABC transporter ATP-binding protein [Sphingobacterium faecium]